MIEFTREHEAELAWYFAAHHSAIGDRSTFGAQLEAMRLASGGSDGTKIRTKANVETATWARRSARVVAGEDAVSEDEPTPSAKPTMGRDRGNDGFTPSDKALEAYAVTSRALMRLSEEEVRALGAYYVLGDRYLAGPYGRYVPVMCLTPPGARLLELRAARRERSHPGAPPEEASPDDMLAAEIASLEPKGDQGRRDLLALAMDQATELLALAQLRYAQARGRR